MLDAFPGFGDKGQIPRRDDPKRRQALGAMSVSSATIMTLLSIVFHFQAVSSKLKPSFSNHNEKASRDERGAISKCCRREHHLDFERSTNRHSAAGCDTLLRPEKKASILDFSSSLIYPHRILSRTGLYARSARLRRSSWVERGTTAEPHLG